MHAPCPWDKVLRMRRVTASFLVFLMFPLLSGCGYSLRDSNIRSPIIENAGIRRVYISPFLNNSYKAGAEILVYNALIKRISSQSEVKIVSSKVDADAIISGTVNSADYSPAGFTAGSNLEPKALGGSFKNVEVASVYSAALSCSFQMEARGESAKRTNGKVWGASFSRSKSFPGNNQLGVFGTTSAIINDSEFDRALSDIAENMMTDVHEALLGMF